VERGEADRRIRKIRGVNDVRRLSLLACSLILLLSACSAPNFQKQSDVVKTSKQSSGKSIIPKYQISGNYYQTILPFEPGATRGMTVSNLNTRYDIDEFETGLQRVAQRRFSPSKYFFREGQELTSTVVQQWLDRKSPSNPNGLNPTDTAGDNSTPMYLSQVLEHDYMVKDGNNTVKLGGVVIGLALNSVYYYQTVQYGPTYEKTISDQELTAQGKAMAQEILTRLRSMKDLKDIPITFALFKAQSKSSVIPGNFFAYNEVGDTSTSLGSWNSINEQYSLFPSTEAQSDHRDDLTAFTNFQQDVEQYFPNYNGVVGTAFYVDGQLQSLTINISIQFYGKTEAIGFVQYVTGLVVEHFPKYIAVTVNVNSVDGPEALIDRQANQSEPYVHIY
jgi:protein involved in sex pheromone biosynthesis